jgi:hypothetical protein
MNELQVMAAAIAQSGLFGVKLPEQAMALMLVAQAEGKHPASVARDYDIISTENRATGEKIHKPAKKAEAMLRDFIEQGGKVEWHALDDTQADATFSHPSGGAVRISWDIARATQAGLGGKDMWRKWPRQMLRSRTVSEGVRTVCPSATSGMYVPEEVRDFESIKDVTPPKQPAKSKPIAEITAPRVDPEKESTLRFALETSGMSEAWFLQGAGKLHLSEIVNVKKALSWIADAANAEPKAES